MTHRVPSYRLHKPSGQAVVTLNSCDFYLGLWQSEASKAEYDRLIAEWVANGRRLPSEEQSDQLTVAELAVGFLAHAESYYANDGETTSEYTCLKDALRPLHELYPQAAVRDFGPLSLKTVRQRMIEIGWCRQYINRQVNRIRRMFKWGVENELVSATVLHALKSVAPLKQGRTDAPESKPVMSVPDEHVDAVVPLVSRQVAAMIQLQRLTGARPGEVVQFRPCDIEALESVWVFRPLRHKTKYRDMQREIYLGPRAQAIVAPFLDREPSAYCFSPTEAEAERNAARRTRRKSPMTPSQATRRPKQNAKRRKRDRYDVASYRRAITYMIKKAGVPHWHPNQLRHSCGTRTRREHDENTGLMLLRSSLATSSVMSPRCMRKWIAQRPYTSFPSAANPYRKGDHVMPEPSEVAAYEFGIRVTQTLCLLAQCEADTDFVAEASLLRLQTACDRFLAHRNETALSRFDERLGSCHDNWLSGARADAPEEIAGEIKRRLTNARDYLIAALDQALTFSPEIVPLLVRESIQVKPL